MPSLADIYLEGGRQQANSELQLAQIEADRRNANAQNITHSIATLADVFGKIPQQIAQNKRQAVEDQTNQLELTQKQKTIKDQKAVDDAFAAGGGDRAAIFDALAKGGQGHLVPGYMKQFADADEAGAKAKTAKEAAAIAEADYFGQLGSTVKANNYSLVAVAAALKHAEDEGHDVSQYRDAIKADPSKVPAIVDALIKASPAQQKLANETQTTQTGAQNAQNATTRLNAELPGLQANAAVAQQVAAGTKNGLTPDQQRQAAQAAASLAVQQQNANTARINATKDGNSEGRITAIPDNAPRGADYLKTLSPTDQSMVKALAEGRQPWPSSFALKMPYWQRLMQKVFQYDPTFDTSQASSNARQKVRNDFTSGASAKQINALNTVVGHLGTLAEASGHLSNSSIPLINSAVNYIKSATGDPSVVNFNTATEAVASELVRVWRQAGGSEQDIQGWKSQLNAANSPAQRQAVFTQIGHLLESKLTFMQDQYSQGMGTAKIEVITPESRKALDTLEGNKSGGGKPMTAEELIKKYGAGK